MYANAKMIPVETTPEIKGWGIKESGRGVISCIIYLIHFKNLCKWNNVPPHSTIIIGKI
jgi:hypothetical protein